MRDLVDVMNPEEPDRTKGRVARITTNGGVPRVVTETDGNPLEEQIESVKLENEQLFEGPCEFAVIITEE